MSELAFTRKQMIAIVKLAKMMAWADGVLDPKEVEMMSIEAIKFGIPIEDFSLILDQSEIMKTKEALATISVMNDNQKRYITAYLGTMMTIDGNIDDSEMKLWRFISLLCDLPEMNVHDAVSYMNGTNDVEDIFHAIIQGNNNPPSETLVFKSNTHQRYEYGVPTRGEQIGCNREIVIEKNISGGIGYSITIKNPDALFGLGFGATPLGTKPMKIVDNSLDKIEMLGYGYDKRAVEMGVPMEDATFENYGMTIHHDGSEITRCVLHMIERNVDIDYYIK